MLMSLIGVLALGCASPPPTFDEMAADIAVRRARHQLPPGSCWVMERLEAGEEAFECHPGPWVDDMDGHDRWADILDRAEQSDDPDLKLLVGVTSGHVGQIAFLFRGYRLQRAALRGGASPELVRRLAPLRWNGDMGFAASSMLHSTALVLIDERLDEGRSGWQTMRAFVDGGPVPTALEWDAYPMSLDDDDPASIIWPAIEDMEEGRVQTEKLWLQALAALDEPSDRSPLTPPPTPAPPARTPR